jgi:hypothetical protein
MLLHHGTTRQRAEAILRDGPDLDFVEPFGHDRAEGFSAAPAEGPFFQGNPVVVARGKATAFLTEGGPCILEFEVPDEVALLAGAPNDVEYRFQPGYGYEELMALWPTLPKRLLIP